MSEVLLSYRGREIRAEDLMQIRQLLADHPGLSRRQLSARLCALWQWVQPNGTPKDMVCRGLMLVLHRRGLIELPPPRQRPPNNVIRHRRIRAVGAVDERPLAGPLSALEPLEIRSVRRGPDEPLFAHLLSAHHYLGYTRPVGEHLKYLVLADGRPVACLGWGSAPRQLGLRDEFLGGRLRQLPLIAYNTRFLILPWVRVPSLASHLLSRIARRISADWQQAYGHPVHLLESFVDTQRYQGTCYRAAHWRCVGRSQRRGTKAPTREVRCPIKEYWVYPLSVDFRRHLLQDP